MNEEQFLQQASRMGYATPTFKDYPANTDGPLHWHEFSVMLLVVSGNFELAFENSATSYLPGECCELAAGTLHAERAGFQGARVLLARKPSDAPVGT